MQVQSVNNWFGAGKNVVWAICLIGGVAVWFARLESRVDAAMAKAQASEIQLTALQKSQTDLAIMDERWKRTQDDLSTLNGKLDRLLEAIAVDARSNTGGATYTVPNSRRRDAESR